ncbi:hypothetical protein BOTBODRAFT_54317 [Botryobasidium botryosum FD-172 SS1]|uniref:Pre-mRNA-splicing factor 18 n=1 Tax=Botryobasidium botryosum (strain FD-172 SS1) TaxID=930990 RepID=A0A067MJX8_BOTB1|nr:hypothetical protein BOTBODRAFT_54317 [Botryobasidium botryosum FD-172 SS1]
MDFLKAEIAQKRKVIQEDTTVSARPNKYMRRGELEKLKEETERKEREAKEREKEAAKADRAAKQAQSSARQTASPAPGGASTPSTSETAFNISNEDAVRRLRAKGQPIRLFGETDKERRLRLRALELIEERDTHKGAGLNDFRKVMEGMDVGLNLAEVEKKLLGGEVKDKEKDKEGDKKEKGKAKDEEGTELLDLGLVKSDPDKLYPIIYYALKKVLKEWGESMDERPDHIKRTTQGKRAAAVQVQSAEYLKPLFKSLRQRNLPSDVLARMAEIVHYMQKRQYQRANDSYLRLSIGNAPWPIGVTMVGIHERSAREKISSDQVAHVLNDEVSRKYIQSLKRLLTFSQTKYPPDDLSQFMG